MRGRPLGRKEADFGLCIEELRQPQEDGQGGRVLGMSQLAGSWGKKDEGHWVQRGRKRCI